MLNGRASAGGPGSTPGQNVLAIFLYPPNAALPSLYLFIPSVYPIIFNLLILFH